MRAISAAISRPSESDTRGSDQSCKRLEKKLIANDIWNHFPKSIRLVYIISNGSGLTLICPRKGLSKAPSI